MVVRPSGVGIKPGSVATVPYYLADYYIGDGKRPMGAGGAKTLGPAPSYIGGLPATAKKMGRRGGRPRKVWEQNSYLVGSTASCREYDLGKV